MNKKRRLCRQRVDAIEGNFECLGDIFISVFTEADVAIADLPAAIDAVGIVVR